MSGRYVRLRLRRLFDRRVAAMPTIPPRTGLEGGISIVLRMMMIR